MRGRKFRGKIQILLAGLMKCGVLEADLGEIDGVSEISRCMACVVRAARPIMIVANTNFMQAT